MSKALTFKHVEYANSVLVDETSFSSLSIQEQAKFISGWAKKGLEVVIKVFPSVNVWNVTQMLDAFEIDADLASSALSTTLNLDDDKKKLYDNMVSSMTAFQKSLLTFREAIRGVYTFEDVPKGYDPLENFIFLKTRVRRVNDSDHFLSNNDAKVLMNHAMKVWSTNSTVGSLSLGRCPLQLHGYSYEVSIFDTYVKVGCQRIERHELEAIAVKLGFNGLPFEDVVDFKRNR